MGNFEGALPKNAFDSDVDAAIETLLTRSPILHVNKPVGTQIIAPFSIAPTYSRRRFPPRAGPPGQGLIQRLPGRGLHAMGFDTAESTKRSEESMKLE